MLADLDEDVSRILAKRRWLLELWAELGQLGDHAAREIARGLDAPGNRDARLDQLAEARDTEAGGDVVAVLALTFGLVFIQNAAPLRGGDAHHQVEVVLFGQLRPLLGDVAIILRRYRKTCRVVYAVVVEEHTENFMALGQRRLGKLISGISCLVLVRAFVYLNTYFHDSGSLP